MIQRKIHFQNCASCGIAFCIYIVEEKRRRKGKPERERERLFCTQIKLGDKELLISFSSIQLVESSLTKTFLGNYWKALKKRRQRLVEQVLLRRNINSDGQTK